VVRPSNIPYAEALTQFARAIGGARSGKLDVARAAHDRLGALADREKELKDAYWESLVRIQQQAASAWIAFAEGRKPEAIDLLTKAADAEDATEKAAVSPGPLAPARELLGDMLLAVDRPADALKAFEAVMKKEPNRFRATAGAAQAAVKAGDRAKAKTYYTKLLEIAKTGDSPGRPELVEARAFLAKS
jgi:tetratricopeptide (TPR) repeat protein